MYKKYITQYNCKNIKLKDLEYLNKYNRVMVVTLNKNYIHLYYILSLIKKIIKRK